MRRRTFLHSEITGLRSRTVTNASLVAILAALLLSSCNPATVQVAPPQIKVDTAALREAKEKAQVEDCPLIPDAEGPVDQDDEDRLPPVELPCLGGGSAVNLQMLRGPMIINLWQSFCPPCREELPALQEFYDRHGERVPILGIDYQDTRPLAAIDLAAETGTRFPSVADPGGEINGRGGLPVIRGVPMLVFIDASGEIQATEPGVDTVAEVEELAQKYFGPILSRDSASPR